MFAIRGLGVATNEIEVRKFLISPLSVVGVLTAYLEVWNVRAMTSCWCAFESLLKLTA